MHFSDLLSAAIARTGAPVCVGLDPDISLMPQSVRSLGDPTVSARAMEAFSVGVIEAVAPHVSVIKFQSACYEMYGPTGVAALITSIAYAKSKGLVTILDAKRGDIGVTAERYAKAAFEIAKADALTVSPYLGEDTITPFLRHLGRGVFVLVRTSNPRSDTVQSHALADGRSVAVMIADLVNALGASRLGSCGLSEVGAVVAATKPQDAAQLRRHMPNTIFLIPGYGAQGGTAADLAHMRREGASGREPETCGMLVTSSRAVIYAQSEPGDSDWTQAVGRAAAALAQEVGRVVLGE